MDLFDLIHEYLLESGFAADEATKIMVEMTDKKRQEILANISEEEADRLKDRRMERGGIDGNKRYDRAPAKKATNKELGIPEMTPEQRAKRAKEMSAHLQKMGRLK
jgi:hypothetical protein